jgi:PAS domain S-box-containing protein
MDGSKRRNCQDGREFVTGPISSAHAEEPYLGCSVPERELRESELKYRTLVETLPHAVIIIQDNKISFANKTAAEVLALGHEEDLIGVDPLEFTADHEKARMRDYLRRRLSGESGVPEQYEAVLITLSGQRIDAEIRVKTFSYKGRIASQLVVTDITGRRQSEIENRLLMESIEQMDEGIAFFGLDDRLLFSNKSFASLHGYDAEELIGKHHSTLVTKEELLSLAAANEETQRVGQCSGELLHASKNGNSFSADFTSSLVRDYSGSPVGMILTVRDISETQLYERVLSHAKEKFSQRSSGLEKQLRETSGQLSDSQTQLNEYARRLEHTNEALKLVISEIENRNRERERAVYRNLNSNVLTIIDQLKSERLPDSSRILLDSLEFNLKSLFSAPAASLPQPNALLTPQQTRVCDFIRAGLTSKQIADVMGISLATVVVHRANIRKRLGLVDSDDNLATYLRSKL